MKHLMCNIFIIVVFLSCSSEEKKKWNGGIQNQIIVDMIAAVNEKNADEYVKGFDESVQVYVASELKVNGRNSLRENRANHFKKHPNVRSAIQHLVEIDNKVILHDKVWLDISKDQDRDIVEIFTFENNKVVRVDVIQPKNLFQ